MNSRKSLILLLSATAAVQIAILVFYYTSKNVAAQDFKSVRSSLFLATTALENVDNDLLWIINTTTHQIGVYKANKFGQIANLASADLTEIFTRETEEEVQFPAATTPRRSSRNPIQNPPASPGKKTPENTTTP